VSPKVVSNKYAAHGALLLVNLLYGINFLVAKEVMPAYIGPSAFIFIRVSCTLVLFALLFFTITREKIDKSDIPRFIICALTGVTINQLLFYEGLNYTTPINAAVIFTSNPILTLLVSAVILKERLTPKKVTGILIGAVGAVSLILLSRGGLSFGGNTQLGNLFIIINALSYAIYLVMAKPLMKKYKPLTVITMNFFMGWFFVTPFGYGQFTQIQWETFTPFVWGALAFTVLGVTFIAYLFSIFALKKLTPSQVSIYVYVQPVTAALLAIFLGKDHFTPELMVCSALIFIGVYLVIKD
jgi:drug/metabolite transporter (DMT)-like permease